MADEIKIGFEIEHGEDAAKGASVAFQISPKHRVAARAAHGNPNPSESIAGIRERRNFLRIRILKGQIHLKRRIPALRANRRMQGNRRGRLLAIQHIRIAVASAVKKRNVAVWLMKRNAKHVPIRQKLIPPEKPAFQPSTELNSQILRAVQRNRTADAAVCAIHIGGIGTHGGGKQHETSSYSKSGRGFLHLPPKFSLLHPFFQFGAAGFIAGLAEQGEHILLVGFDAGLVEGVHAQ